MPIVEIARSAQNPFGDGATRRNANGTLQYEALPANLVADLLAVAETRPGAGRRRSSR